VMLEETLKRYPGMQLASGAGRSQYVESFFINQLKLLPVRLAA